MARLRFANRYRVCGTVGLLVEEFSSNRQVCLNRLCQPRGQAHGHTPGHQVLYLKLAKTGGVVLSGDLYHYPEERSLDRVPTFEFNPAQTRATRVAIDAFLKKTGAQLWIQHDFNGFAKLKKSPGFYE
jgi:hypothetical protein